MTKKKTKVAAQASDKEKPLSPEERKKLENRVKAAWTTDGEWNAAGVLEKYTVISDQDVDALEKVLKAQAEKIHNGDMRQVETMLISQASALQGMFANMVRRASSSNQIPTIDLYMKFALRAQNQCRMTLETLANIKNPPVVYARQANIAQGHQQINNGVPEQMRAREEKTIPTNELLEAHDGKRLDTGAQGKAGRDDLEVETVEISGSQNTRRKRA